MKQITMAEKRYGQYADECVASSLKACSGSVGGGSEVLVIMVLDVYNYSTNENGITKTLNSIRSDTDHIPCVLLEKKP